MKKAHILSLSLILATLSAFAQWQQSGPYGGNIRCVAASGSNIFAANEFGGGVYFSSDNGNNWVAAGLQNTYISSLTINGDYVIAGGGGLHVSSDNGNSWMSTGPENAFIMSLAASDSKIYAGTDYGMLISSDNGSTWDSAGIFNAVRSIAISGNNIFAGTYDGVFLSSNNGSTWTATGMTNQVYSLATDGNNIFAGTVYVLGGYVYYGLFLSSDNGSTWDLVNMGIPDPFVTSIAISGSNIFAGVAADGVFLSSDNGSNWSPVNTGLTNLYPSSLATSGSNIYAGTYGGGVFLSSNIGTSWTEINTGISNVTIWALATDGSDIFVGTRESGMFFSANYGTTWTHLNNGLPEDATIRSIGLDGSYVYAGTDAGVFLSSDSGNSWTASSLTNYITALLINGDYVFAGVSWYDKGIYLSTDHGINWSLCGPSNLGNVWSFAKNGNDIYAGTEVAELGSVFLSSDNGSNWNSVSDGLPLFGGVRYLAVKGEYIFAGTEGFGIYRSLIQTISWEPVNDGLESFLNVFSLAISGDDIFAGAFDDGNSGGVFVSSDNGNSWESMSTGLPVDQVRCLSICGDSIYAGTQNCSVWKRALSELTGINEKPVVSRQSSVVSNYPNPARTFTMFEYSLEESIMVTLKLFNQVGQQVAVPVNELQTNGDHQMQWNVEGMPAGIYYYTLTAGKQAHSGKIVVME